MEAVAGPSTGSIASYLVRNGAYWFNNSAMRSKSGRLLWAIALTGVIITTVTCGTATSQPRREPAESRVAIAVRVDHPPRLDGTLHDPLWQVAHPISDFRQREPYEGRPAIERTEVRILYTRHAVYFGINCFQQQASIIATQLRRDISQQLDDYVEIVIDSTHDRRYAYVFQVNPLGTQMDGLITEEQSTNMFNTGDFDSGWDGVWTSAAQSSETGWTATVEIPFSTLNSLSSSIHAQSMEANFGVGAKIAAVPRNHAGIIYLSWKNGQGYMIHIWRDPATGVYGLRRFERPDGSAEYWTAIEDTVKPEQIGKHGTMVILLGNADDENTAQAPPGTAMPSRWILRYLNSRYFRFPRGITVKAREGWELPRGDSHNFLRTVTGMEAWLTKNCIDHGAQQLSGADAYWWILNDKLDLDAGHYVSGGHVAALYQDELYDLQTGRAGVSRLQAFGVIFGHQRVAILSLGTVLVPVLCQTPHVLPS